MGPGVTSIGRKKIIYLLASFKTKKDAEPFLAERGFVLKDNVTKNTKFLINESGVASVKTKKAEATGIEIITNILEI